MSCLIDSVEYVHTFMQFLVCISIFSFHKIVLTELMSIQSRRLAGTSCLWVLSVLFLCHVLYLDLPGLCRPRGELS